MQRTVKATKVKYATIEIVNGEVTTAVNERIVTETKPEKVEKVLRKYIPNAAIISMEIFEELWVLDDEIFFKYAHPVKNGENQQ